MTRFKTFFAPFFGLLLAAGCSFQDASPSADVRTGAFVESTILAATRTTLVARPGTATDVAPGRVGEDVDAFGLPRRAVFTFRTCLVDRATTQPVRGVTVVVSGGAQPQQVVANAVGCIDWSETVAYRRLAPERLLAWPRTLDVNGHRLKLDLALNPWARMSEALVDFSGDSKPTGLLEDATAIADALSGRGDSSPARALQKEVTNLAVPQLVVRRSEAGVGARGSRVEYRLAFTLTAGRRTLDGGWTREPLTTGKFKVVFSVWEQLAGEAAEAIAEPVTIENATLHDGQLEAAGTAEYQRALADGADLHLKYRLEPVGGDDLLLPSEGWMQLRRGHNSDSALPSTSPPGRLRNGDVRPGPAGPEATVGFQVQSLTVTKFKVGVARDWNLPIDLKARVCLVTADDHQPIVATSTRQFSFQLSTDATPGKNWVPADETQNNCFVVRKPEAVQCELAQKERYVPMYLHIKAEDARFRGAVQTRRFAVNPWQRERQEQFFVDAPDEAQLAKLNGELDSGTGGDGVSQLVLQNVTYEFAGKTSRVNEFLQNVGLRRYRLTLRPKLWSPWRSHSGHDETEPVFRGLKFRAHGIFSTPPNAGTAPTAKQYLGEFVTDFEIEDNGEASRTIVLPVDFPEAHRLRSAVTLTLRLTPLPSTDRRRPHARVYRISFDPLVERSSGNSRTEASFLSRDVSYGDFLALVPTAGEPAKGNFDGFEEKIPRSAAIQRWDVEGIATYGLQPKFVGKPIDLFARYWRDTSGVRSVHLTQDRREAGWAFWTGGAVSFPDEEKTPVALPELDRNSLLRDLLEGPVARGTSVKLPKGLLDALCTYYAPGDGTCADAPGQHFDAVTTFVAANVAAQETTLAPAEAEGQLTPRISVQASFFKEVGYQERAQRGDKGAWTASAGVQSKFGAENLGTGGGFIGSAGYGVEQYHSTEIGVVDGLRNRRAQATSYELYARKFAVDMRVDGDACLLVRPFNSGANRPRPAILYCASATNVDRSENWYEILDSAGGAPTVVGDPTNPAERGWLRTVRGDAALTRLRQRLMDDTAGAVFHKVGPWIEAFSVNLPRSAKAMVEGTAMDEFSAAGAQALVSRDGGLFPGVFEMNPAVSSFQENWSEKAFNEKMHAVYQGVVATALERGQMAFVVKKDDAGRDVRVPDIASEAKQSETYKQLRQSRAFSRCLVAEYARRCSLGLYERDRALCLTTKRKAARAEIEPEMESERKRINSACASLAKGAFP